MRARHIIFGIILSFLLAASSWAQGVLIPNLPEQFFNLSAPIAAATGYKLCTYQAGTTTLLATFQDSALTTPNANPVTLGTGGLAGSIYVNPATPYKYVLRTAGTDSTCSTGTVLWTRDNVAANGALSGTSLDCSGISSATTYSGILNACANTLPSGGGTADMRKVTNTTWNSDALNGVTIPTDFLCGATAITVSTTSTIPSNAHLVGSQGCAFSVNGGVTLTINGRIDGTPTFSGAGTVAINNQPVQCTWFSGADMAAKLTACFNAIGTSGGIMDATGFTGAQTFGTTVTLSKPVLLRLGAAVVTCNANPCIAVTASGNGVKIQGAATISTVSAFNAGGNTVGCITIATTLSRVSISDLVCYGTGAASTAVGVLYTNSNSNMLDRVTISLFNYGVRYSPGANSSFLNEISDSLIQSNNVTNIDGQAGTNYLNLKNITFGGGPAATGIKLVDSAGLSIFGGDCEGVTAGCLDIDTTSNSLIYDGFRVIGVDFEANTSTNGDIRLGNTNKIYGVTIDTCQFAAGASSTYPINAQKVEELSLLGNVVESGYMTSNYPNIGTVTNMNSIGNRWASPFTPGVFGLVQTDSSSALAASTLSAVSAKSNASVINLNPSSGGFSIIDFDKTGSGSILPGQIQSGGTTAATFTTNGGNGSVLVNTTSTDFSSGILVSKGTIANVSAATNAQVLTLNASGGDGKSQIVVTKSGTGTTQPLEIFSDSTLMAAMNLAGSNVRDHFGVGSSDFSAGNSIVVASPTFAVVSAAANASVVTLNATGGDGKSQLTVAHSGSGMTQPLEIFSDSTLLATFQPNSALKIAGTGQTLGTTVGTFAQLPGSPSEGDCKAISDSTTSTFLATIAGSGTNHVIACWNGSNWVVH